MTTAHQNFHVRDPKADELVGILLFQATVTLSLAQADVSGDMLRSNALHFIRSFDYHATNQRLQTMGINPLPETDTDPQKAFFQMLGRAYRSLPASISDHITQDILRTGREQETGDTATSTIHFLGASNPFREEGESSHSEPPTDEMLPMYTSALYEEAAKRGVVPNRSGSVLSLDPPQFRVTLQFGALEATGIGRNKKIAAHLAAKTLCDRLNVTF